VSYGFAKDGWEVRWREATGRQRSRRFRSEEAASEFDQLMREQNASVRRAPYGSSSGVYSYETAAGTRWRYSLKRTDGSYTSKRGFQSKRTTTDARRRMIKKQERGEIRHTKETFDAFWARWLARRKPYLEPGTWGAYERDGRLGLLPALGSVPLGQLGVEHVRSMLDELARALEARKLSTKTINNTLGTACRLPKRRRRGRANFDESGAARSALARRVRRARLPPSTRDNGLSHVVCRCLAPVAELLIGGGLRISEALALCVNDLELEPQGGVVRVYRSRKRDGVSSTKSDRFRSVEIGRQSLEGARRATCAPRRDERGRTARGPKALNRAARLAVQADVTRRLKASVSEATF
jgi:integrase